ncbi:MAG: hypothetical protein CM1200mP10_25130 [Candidatus Neomarinimicrobiota bacterium]|nr:MAG: hypothetical protein CM1200mP10_25130 [Candidatus Neomarinimicrobiota bacterium]
MNFIQTRIAVFGGRKISDNIYQKHTNWVAYLLKKVILSIVEEARVLWKQFLRG